MKLVLFDWGGVIESHDRRTYSQYKAIINLIRTYKEELSEKEAIDIWFKSIDINGKKLTIINDEDKVYVWINNLSSILSVKINEEEFLNKYKVVMDKIFYYKKVVKLAKKIKKKCKIGIFSNLFMIDYERLNKQVCLSDFNYLYLSYKLESEKPNKDIYIKVLNDCNINPEDILFIDDNDINLKVPKELGWKTLCAHGYDYKLIKKTIKLFLNNKL